MNGEKKKRGKSVRVVRVTISTRKAHKIISKASPRSIHYKSELEREAYLDGIRDIIGGDLGFSFRREVLSGDIKRVARFCTDGWRVTGCDAAEFSTGMDCEQFLRELRNMCTKYLSNQKVTQQ